MTLHAIVAALGGDLYQNGHRANVPAPGHSAADRSVSLLLTNGRVIVHGFGGADWRTARDALLAAGFIDAAGRLNGEGRSGPSAPKPDLRLRITTARALWDGALALQPHDAASAYLRRRSVVGGFKALSLRFPPAAAVSVYRPRGRTRPALIAGILDADDQLTAVELTYLEPNGLPARGLSLSRKTVGVAPSGAAVRLSPVAAEMLVGEGVITTLSAIDRFQLPGWALRSANSLAAWTPPPGVRSLLIAADRGAVGEGAAARLRHRVLAKGIDARVLCPDPPFGDWNEAARGAPERKEQGRRGAPE
jgi:putative DNA primase/helicase